MEKDIIYSKSFKSWFGDWENDPEHSSKVFDKNGKHGGLKPFKFPSMFTCKPSEIEKLKQE